MVVAALPLALASGLLGVLLDDISWPLLSESLVEAAALFSLFAAAAAAAAAAALAAANARAALAEAMTPRGSKGSTTTCSVPLISARQNGQPWPSKS